MGTVAKTSLRKANLLLGAQLLSDIGDQITFALLALSILDISQSTREVGFVYFIETFGLILFTLLGGIIGDKFNIRKTLFISDLGRAFVVLMMIAAFKLESITLIYGTSFTLAILGAIHTPANMSAWALYIPIDYLSKYNNFSQSVKQIASITGPLIAAFFVARNWTQLGFAIDSLTFIVCAIVFANIVSRKNIEVAPNKTMKERIWAGFEIINKEKVLKAYVAYDAIQMICFGAFNATFLVLAQRDFGWAKTDYSFHLTIVAGFIFLASVLGTLKFIAKINDSRKLIFCTLVSALAYFIMLHIKIFPYSSFLVGICDCLAVLTVSITRTKAQRVGSKLYPTSLSSLLAARRVILSSASLLGTSLCFVLENFISLETTLTILVAPLVLCAVPIMLLKVPSSTTAQILQPAKVRTLK